MKKALIIFLCLIISFSGCDTPDEPDIDEIPDDDNGYVVDELLPFPITIGGTIIEDSPETVVSLSPSLTEIIYELGFGSRLTGRSSYCDFPPAALSVTDTGSGVNPDIERIIALSPELVLTTTLLSQKDMFRMEQSGITTLFVPPSTNINELRNIYQALGLVFTGAFTGAEAGDEAFSAISRVCDNRDVVSLGSFIYITGGLRAATGDTLEHSVFSCFGVNLAERGSNYQFDFETFIVNQPDVILLSDKYTTDDLLSSDDFSELNAVIEGRIVYIDNTVFERPSSRIVQVIEQMLEDYKNLG